MKNIMLYCFFAVKHRLKSRIGYFDLYGFDFLIDENMKVVVLAGRLLCASNILRRLYVQGEAK